MSNDTRLEIKGTLSEHPFAELLAETTEAGISGSFRLSDGDKKTIIYLNQGAVVFAVSNLREHRLFAIALSEGKIEEESLRGIQNVGNDMELSGQLVDKGIMSQKDVKSLTTRQICAILEHCLTWNSGEWSFSSLARIKDGIEYPVDHNSILLEFARKLETDQIVERFGSEGESFGIKPESPFHLNLQSHEAFVLSRFDQEFIPVSELDSVSGLPTETTRQVLYSLWLGGFLFRKNWNSVLSEKRIAGMLEAKLKLVVESEPVAPVIVPIELAPAPELTETESEAITEELKEINEEQALYEYLERIEAAVTLYETIGVAQNAETPQIKQAYFAQAKKYHPDLFHQKGDLHSRIQDAFTNIAQAYETLKESETRDLYDFKMRKELAEIKEREATGITATEANLNKQAEKAADNFQWGMNLLEEDEPVEAIPFFARAVHFDPDIAKYRAYYGKALASDKKNLHKAETEIQIALKIEPGNVAYRYMLAELFVHIGLRKRAEGELTKLLSMAPANREAMALLDSLESK